MATDPQVAMQMAQQEMDYRVELFNKWVGERGRAGGPSARALAPAAADARSYAARPHAPRRMVASCYDKCIDKRCVGLRRARQPVPLRCWGGTHRRGRAARLPPRASPPPPERPFTCTRPRYKEGDLSVGENSCIDRCSSKYWQVTGIVGQLLGAQGAQ